MPETNDKPVKLLVAHNFKEYVHDNSKNALVYYYSEDCKSCGKVTKVID